MTEFDYIILAIIIISSLIGLWRGFIREAFSLALWILAFWVAWTFFKELDPHLIQWIESPTLRMGASFGILMISTLIVGGIVNFLLIQLVEKTGMTGTDRIMGMVFGAARGALLVAVVFLLAGLTTLPQETWWKASVLAPYLQELAYWIRDMLPPEMAERFQYALHASVASEFV